MSLHSSRVRRNVTRIVYNALKNCATQRRRTRFTEVFMPDNCCYVNLSSNFTTPVTYNASNWSANGLRSPDPYENMAFAMLYHLYYHTMTWFQSITVYRAINTAVDCRRRVYRYER